MPRYVILEHDHPFLHWDFMLEDGSVLQTWRLAAVPTVDTIIPATYLAAHRLLYLDYEGPVSDYRGQVRRWDAGTFTWLKRDEGQIEVQLHGERLHIDAYLQKTSEDKWSFSCRSADQC